MENYIRVSLETHLFFARIMKEHSLFLQAGFLQKDVEWMQQADHFREQFEDFLRRVVSISNRVISGSVLNSQELVTPFTIMAEQKTSDLSGVPIDSRITHMEKQLQCGRIHRVSQENIQQVSRLNQEAIWLLDGLIEFKEAILGEVRGCMLFTANYPLLVEHIIREAKLYRNTLRELMKGKRVCYKNLQNQEAFWNQIMMEHALFIRGLLDPSEEELIYTADEFAMDYKELLEMAKRQDCRATEGLTEKSLEETLKLREFKIAGTKGILECKIESLILPLLADHVLREANHYIRILKCGYEWTEE